MTLAPDVLAVTTRADHIPGPPQGQWRYADYAAIPDDGVRYEIVDGVLYMAPAPTTFHQSVNNLIATYLTIHVQFAGLGRVFAAPTDLELPAGDIVQPDMLVVLHGSNAVIEASRVISAPDLVVEIASPGTSGYDRREKQNAYARAGIAEYWIADPNAKTVEVLALDGTAYRSLNVFSGKATLPSNVVSLPVPVEQFYQ